MELIAQVVAKYASFFDSLGNYVLIPLFVSIFILDWRLSKSSVLGKWKKVVRSLLSISALVLGIFIYLINFPFKPLISALAEVDKNIGSEMVHFEFLNVATGGIETLSDYDDKTIVLNFWGTYCPPCIQEFPDLRRLESDFADDLVIIAVSDENPEKIKAFISRIKSPSIIGSQPDYQWINPQKFLPLTIIISEGKVRSRFFGRRTYVEFVEIIQNLE